jgi:peptidoglycan endopeptidase LytF
MSRRDTIIIAVLVNAGLLIILFASALKTDQSEPEFASQPSPTLTPPTELSLQKEGAIAGSDEFDQALGQMNKAAPGAVAATSAQPTPLAQSSLPAPALDPSAAPVNFADDLKAFGQPEGVSAGSSAAVASAEKPQEASSGFTEIKVKKGDVLDKIARRNHTTVDEIMKLNGLTSSRLKIGQPLRIPSKQSGVAKAPAAKSQGASAEGGSKFYTVKNGDNPWTIAVKNHMKVDELLKLNNMNEEKARHLKPGDQLRIR